MIQLVGKTLKLPGVMILNRKMNIYQKALEREHSNTKTTTPTPLGPSMLIRFFETKLRCINHKHVGYMLLTWRKWKVYKINNMYLVIILIRTLIFEWYVV